MHILVLAFSLNFGLEHSNSGWPKTDCQPTALNNLHILINKYREKPIRLDNCTNL